MICPQCNSDNTQKVSIIYDQGTSNTSTTSHTTAKPLFSLFPTATAKTKTSGTTMSNAAEKVAPPSKVSYKFSIIGMVVGLAVSSSLHLGIIGLIIGVLIIGFFGYVLFNAIKFNKKEWPVHYENWTKLWKCNKCGSVYS